MKARFFTLIVIGFCGLALSAKLSAAGEPINLRSIFTIKDAHARGVAGLVFSGDSQFLLSVGHSLEVKFWDLKTGLRARVLPMKVPGRVLAFSPSGKLLAAGGGEFISGAYQGGITLWNTADWTEIRSMDIPNADVNVLVFLDEATLVSAGYSGSRVWDVATGRQTRHAEHPAAVLAMDLSPDKTLLGFGSFTAECYLVRTKDWSGVHTFPPQKSEPRSAAFSKDGALFFSGNATGTLIAWEEQSGKEISKQDVGPALWGCLPLDGQTAIVVGGEHQQEGLIAICDLKKGTVLRKIPAHNDSIHAIATNAAGGVFATGAADGSILVWSIVK